MKKKILYMVGPKKNWQTRLWMFVLQTFFFYEKFVYEEKEVCIKLPQKIREKNADRIEELRPSFIVEFNEEFYNNLTQTSWQRMRDLLPDYEIVTSRTIVLSGSTHTASKLFESSRRMKILMQRRIFGNFYTAEQ